MIAEQREQPSWQTKPSDRFVLRWIKVHLSARITPHLIRVEWLRPWMITWAAAKLGVIAGFFFALGWGGSAGTLAAVAQVLDGVDGQYARLTGTESRGGAFWDSVLDRYADGAMLFGMIIYLFRLPVGVPLWLLLFIGYMAMVGSNLISYSTARAEALGLDLGRPTLASKGTRTSVTILCAWGSMIWPPMPIIALVYLAVHTNQVVIFGRLLRTIDSGRASP